MNYETFREIVTNLYDLYKIDNDELTNISDMAREFKNRVERVYFDIEPVYIFLQSNGVIPKELKELSGDPLLAFEKAKSLFDESDEKKFVNVDLLAKFIVGKRGMVSTITTRPAKMSKLISQRIKKYEDVLEGVITYCDNIPEFSERVGVLDGSGFAEVFNKICKFLKDNTITKEEAIANEVSLYRETFKKFGEEEESYRDVLDINKLNFNKRYAVNIDDFVRILFGMSFGIELETCVNKTEDDSKDFIIKMIGRFNEKTELLQTGIRWGTYNIKYKNNADYTQWNIVKDMSIGCPDYSSIQTFDSKKTPKYCAMRTKTGKCPYLIYEGIEFVSPIMSMYEYDGLSRISHVWKNYLFSEDITYLVNPTQGFHVHLSHPQLDALKFIKLWVIFEPYILNIIPKYRKGELMDKFSKPLIEDSETILKSTDFEDLIKRVHLNKYRSVNFEYYNEDEKRIEIRLYPSTMIYQEVHNWICFCLIMASTSIFLSMDEIMDYASLSEQDDILLEIFFTEIIRDTNVSNYFYLKFMENETVKFSENKHETITSFL